MNGRKPALVFDSDGSLVDSVYQHVLAWHEALLACGIELSIWRIHRRMGMTRGCSPRRSCARWGRARVGKLAPDQIGIAPDLLGNADLETTRRYYIQAQGMTAHDRIQEMIDSRRRAAAAGRESDA